MIIDRSDFKEYPFRGKFTRTFIDKTKPRDEWTEETITVLETDCDIQEASKTDDGGFVNASFNVYFPFDKEVGVDLKRGDMFEGEAYGLKVNGEVIGVIPNQLSGCTCYIKDIDV